MGGGGNALGALHTYAVCGFVDAGQGGSQPMRVADDLGADAISIIFARARDRHLNEHRGEGGDDGCGNDAENVAAAVAAAEQHRELQHVGHHGNRASDSGGDGHDEGVAVLNVSEFVGHDGCDFLSREHFEEAG